MRLKRLKRISYLKKSGVSVLLIAGILGGCSSDFSRFTDGIEKPSTSSQQVTQSQASAYPPAPRQDGYGHIESRELASPSSSGNQTQSNSESRNYDNGNSGLNTSNTDDALASSRTQANSQSQQYQVISGDTLSGIAAKYSVRVSTIRKANNLNGNKILIGQVLTIPVSMEQNSNQVDEIDQPKSVNETEDYVPVPTPEPNRSSSSSNSSSNTYTKSSGQSAASPSEVEADDTASAEAESDLDNDSVDETTDDSAGDNENSSDVATENNNDVSSNKQQSNSVQQSSSDKQSATENNNTQSSTTQSAAAEKNNAAMIWPLQGKVISAYGQRTGTSSNDGIDIAVTEGTNVKAADGGTVIYAGSGLREFGNTVLIRHNDNVVTVYGHNSKLMVQRGQKVKRGDVIALSGHSGNASRAQLHFEVRKNSAPVDPMKYLPKAN